MKNPHMFVLESEKLQATQFGEGACFYMKHVLRNGSVPSESKAFHSTNFQSTHQRL